MHEIFGWPIYPNVDGRSLMTDAPTSLKPNRMMLLAPASLSSASPRSNPQVAATIPASSLEMMFVCKCAACRGANFVTETVTACTVPKATL